MQTVAKAFVTLDHHSVSINDECLYHVLPSAGIESRKPPHLDRRALNPAARKTRPLRTSAGHFTQGVEVKLAGSPRDMPALTLPLPRIMSLHMCVIVEDDRTIFEKRNNATTYSLL